MSLTNTKPEIKKWLRQQPANTALCVEATNVYHLDVVEMAPTGIECDLKEMGRLSGRLRKQALLLHKHKQDQKIAACGSSYTG
jgi:hypothetical protein